MTDTIPTTTTPVEAAPRRPIRWSMIALWLAVIAILAVLAWGLLNATAGRPEVGQAAPDFTVEFFNGYEWDARPVADLSDMRGRPVVLNFWASWCVECRYETDVLEQTWLKYRDDGVVFLGVAYADVEPNSIAYMKEFGVTFPHAPDLGTDISQDYEITGVPETFFIDKDGVIRHVQIGAVDEQLLDTIIPQMLAE
ncbi:MAG: redoxin domain-containing protein [Anaerolineae bacterium]|uniref:TlpA family protein disulfide reductase n=1 Tax=Promineifilum sp. TaxID=2664178 RepID=UPI001D2E2155|nr:redoxin domain-containing protein [Anaerolineales bacterium]MCB8934367.1 redoxin domain-containing protein [Promineifilum sp.]MCO5180306.1 TlpA family protein disulfide reductase [Promineifilum sp.]MCW5847328.1 redoxin domain-containing protein [Anaerolineae bacterium]